MKYIQTVSIAILMLALAAVPVQAKWWIFGQSEDEIIISYLYLNTISFDESTEQVTLYRETLQDGVLRIRGKARVGTGEIGGVRISTDGKVTWHEARLADNGAFDYAFTPEIGKTYSVFVEITDTRGRTNDAEETAKEVTVAEGSIRAQVEEVLNALIEAYCNEDARRFMTRVSEDFTGDDTTLDRAIRQDFTAFDNIDLRYVLGTIAVDNKGLIYVTLNFNRFLTSTRSGENLNDRGTTEFIFRLEDGGPRVYSMKNPLIFGLSDASEVATGTVFPASNDPIIVVDDRGNVEKKPFDEATRIMDGDDDDGVESGNNIVLTIDISGHPPGGFDFVTGEVTAGFGGAFAITGHTQPPIGAYGFLDPGVLIKDLGTVSLNDVSEAPASGYSDGTPPLVQAIELHEGHTYAFQLPGPKYGLLYVRSVTAIQTDITVIFDYKYQPDGSRNF